MSKVTIALFFSILLLMIVPGNVYGDFTYESCMPEFGKTKMMKNNDDTGRIYCVSVSTAEKLEERGWGTLNHNYFFVKLQIHGGNTPFRNFDDVIFLVDYKKQKDIFDKYEKDCQIQEQEMFKSSKNKIDCFVTFYNNTVFYSPWLAGEDSKIENFWAQGIITITDNKITYYFENNNGTYWEGKTTSLETFYKK